MEKYIEFEHIGKTFPGQKALDDVSFSIRKGEIHAIIGENGAGKSTLLNILHGVFPATTGEIKINGKTVKFSNVADAIEKWYCKSTPGNCKYSRHDSGRKYVYGKRTWEVWDY